MEKEYKLFVWEGSGVLQDYTPGLIVVVARDLEEALTKIREKCDYCMSSFPADGFKNYPLDEASAFLTWGGG